MSASPYNHDKFLGLLHEFESLPDTQKSESIFDIAGYPHYENVCSNILAFYLNPNNEHGLGNLLFSSLINLADRNESQQDNFQINREVSTNKGGRLDIVIETDNHIVGIENKIFHHLNNDLNDYSNSIDDWAKPNQLSSVKIILRLKREQKSCSYEKSCGFVSITYEEFWAKIRERLGNYVNTSSQKWVLYLIDFMSTIDRLNGKNMELDKNDQFFIENEERVNALLNARNKFVSKLVTKVRKLLDIIPKPDQCVEQWIYAKFCLVHNFTLSGNDIAFDLYISSQGWELQLFGRDAKSQAYLTELFSILPMSEHKANLRNSRYILKEYDLSEELEFIKDELLKWFGFLIETENLKNANKANPA